LGLSGHEEAQFQVLGIWQ